MQSNTRNGDSPTKTTLDAPSRTTTSRPSLEDHVRGRLGRPADTSEATRHHHLTQTGLAGLGAQGQTDFLRQRRRGAYHHEEAVINSPQRMEIVFQPVAGQGLDDQPSAILRQSLAYMPGRPDRVAHIMQTIEERHQFIAIPGVDLRLGHVEFDVSDALLGRQLAGTLDRAVVVVESE